MDQDTPAQLGEFIKNNVFQDLQSILPLIRLTESLKDFFFGCVEDIFIFIVPPASNCPWRGSGFGT